MWKSEKVRMTLLKAFGLAGVAVLIYGGISACFEEKALAQQQDPFLSRRIDQMEQRFYTIESRLNRIETDTRPTLSSPPRVSNNNDLEIQFLRQQVDGLRARLGEAECGLLHVDERTMTPAARAARTKAATNTDPCRRDPGNPVILSARP